MPSEFSVVDARNVNKYIDLQVEMFSEHDVDLEEVNSANAFLLALWELFDRSLSPIGLNGKCPWAFFPFKMKNGKKTLTYLGSIRTKIGYLHVLVSYKKKGSIEKIHFFSQDTDMQAKKQVKLIQELIKSAKVNAKVKNTFYLICELKQVTTVDKNARLLESYKGENFMIFTEKEKTKMIIKIEAQNRIDALNLSVEMLNSITSFLSIETNLLFENSDVDFIEGFTGEENYRSIFQEDKKWKNQFDENLFIDFYPTYNKKIILSKLGIVIIEMILRADYKKDKMLNTFLKSCYFFKTSLKYELGNDGELLYVTGQSVLSKKKKVIQVDNIVDNSVTGYLSSIEIATSSQAQQNTCEACGQLKYSISYRIKEFVDNYFDKEFGGIFKKIYSMRSKYLHAGESPITYTHERILPLLDPTTGTGAINKNAITVFDFNRSISISISNLREWTSYSLRNYYKREIVSTRIKENS